VPERLLTLKEDFVGPGEQLLLSSDKLVLTSVAKYNEKVTPHAAPLGARAQEQLSVSKECTVRSSYGSCMRHACACCIMLRCGRCVLPKELPSNADFVACWSGKADANATGRLAAACGAPAAAAAVRSPSFQSLARAAMASEDAHAAARLQKAAGDASGGPNGGGGKAGGGGAGGKGAGGNIGASRRALPSLPMRKAASSDGALVAWVAGHSLKAWRKRCVAADPTAAPRWPAADDKDGGGKDGDGEVGGEDGSGKGGGKGGQGGKGGGAADGTAELAEQLAALQVQMKEMLALQQASSGGGGGGGGGGSVDPRAASEPRPLATAPKRGPPSSGASFSGKSSPRSFSEDRPLSGDVRKKATPRANKGMQAPKRRDGGGGGASGTRIKAL
jgi:hypothetical protein